MVGCFFPYWQDGEAQEYLLRDAPGGLADGVASQYRVFNADAILPTASWHSARLSSVPGAGSDL